MEGPQVSAAIARPHARTTPAAAALELRDTAVPTLISRPVRVRPRDSAGVRVPCGARRRRDGQPCEALSVPGKRRCKWHGGCSTGPKTAAGKAKCAKNLPRRDGEFRAHSARPRGSQ